MSATLRGRWRGINAAAARDRGSMSMVMIITIVGMGLGALIVPMIITQTRATLHTDTRVQALHAAETGMDGMLGLIRTATADGGVSGAVAKLPCYQAGTAALTGNIAGSTTTSYSVSLTYYVYDPLKPAPAVGNPVLTCTAGTGTSDSTGLVVPRFARIVATGNDAAGGKVSSRVLYTTYSFDTTNANTVGGRIRLYASPTATDTSLCLQAVPVPAPDTPISVVACNPPLAATQNFVYNSDLSLQLVSSITPARPYGLCVATDGVAAIGTPVKLQACSAPGAPPGGQKWSMNDTAQFRGTRADLSTFCLAPDTGTPKQLVVAQCTAGSNSNTTDSWVPVPSVGAGAAGAANGQLVNFSQFDRCVSASDQTGPPAATAAMILNPCTQDTRKANVGWSQQFTFTATGQWKTTTSGTDYCLTSPGVNGGYVTLTACDTSDAQKWTEFGVTAATQGDASKTPYAKRYTIVDNANQCLSLSPISGVDASGNSLAKWYVPPGTHRQYSKITVATCELSGTASQKWNAFPQPSALQNTKEKKGP